MPTPADPSVTPSVLEVLPELREPKEAAGTPGSPTSCSLSGPYKVTGSPEARKSQRTEAKVLNKPPRNPEPRDGLSASVPSWNTISKLGTCPTGKHHVLARFLF